MSETSDRSTNRESGAIPEPPFLSCCSVVSLLLLLAGAVVLIPVAFVLGMLIGSSGEQNRVAQSQEAELETIIASDPERFAHLEVGTGCGGYAWLTGEVHTEEDRELLERQVVDRMGTLLSERIMRGVSAAWQSPAVDPPGELAPPPDEL